MCADPLLDFLKQCQNDGLGSTPENSVVCMGNEAGDLDSLASAIAFAYLSKFVDTTKRYIPLYQQGRHDYALRPENIYALQQAQIDSKIIPCLDDLPPQTLSSSACKYALVDHNCIGNRYVQEELSDRVAAIVDHHVDEHQHLSANPRFITMDAGSCASLVTNYFADTLGAEQLSQTLTPSLRTLLIGAIIIDTGNLKPVPQGKATEQDRRAISILSSSSDASFNASSAQPTSIDHYFARLREAKSDIASLCLRDQFRRDYKSFITSNHYTVGLSSVLLSAEDLAQKEGWEGFANALKAWAQESRLDVAGVLTNYRRSNGQGAREVLLLPVAAALKDTLANLVDEKDSNIQGLRLAKWDDHQPSQVGLLAFKQENDKATRKQVLPGLRGVIEAS